MKILVTGGGGLVGKSLQKFLPQAIYISSKNYDLTNETCVIEMFQHHMPDVVVHLAAKVGGIIDNINYPVQFLDQNVLMNTYVVKYAHQFGVKKLLSILSTCIYPDVVASYPMLESQLHDGLPTKTNLSYGYAKRLAAIQIDTYNQQYSTNYNYLIPCNLYGENDKFDERAHFVSALLKRIIDAKKKGLKEITLFGDGTALRQFMYVDDLSKVIVHWLNNDIKDNVNVATDQNLTIKQIAEIALQACDADLELKFDTSKPNGQYRKDVSIDKLLQQMPEFKPTSLYDGIKKTYDMIYDQIN